MYVYAWIRCPSAVSERTCSSASSTLLAVTDLRSISAVVRKPSCEFQRSMPPAAATRAGSERVRDGAADTSGSEQQCIAARSNTTPVARTRYAGGGVRSRKTGKGKTQRPLFFKTH